MTSSKRSYGLIGYPLGHSRSPQIHQAISACLREQAEYHMFEIKKDELVPFFDSLRHSDLAGINVTIPYKRDVLAFLDECTRESNSIGAVNTILIRNGRLIGYNTDYHGFLQTLEVNSLSIKGKNVLMIGDGGVARTVYAVALDQKAAGIDILSRKPEVSAPLFEQANVQSYDFLDPSKQYGLIVNCTPIGMTPHPDRSPLMMERMPISDALVDLIYNPPMTRLMEQAQKKGMHVANGLYMLVAQAVAAREIWSERKFPREVTEEVFAIMARSGRGVE